jgi:hypothetical protein
MAAALHGGQALLAAQASPTPMPSSTDADSTPKADSTVLPPARERASSDDAAPASAEVPRVLVPVDDKQQLVGQKYYVPESLFVELDRLAATAGGKPRGWLISQCVYRGTLVRNPASKQLSADRLRMQCSLQRREGADNPVVAVRLDGQVAGVSWNAAGDELSIGELAAGRYRLEVELQVRMQSYGTTAGFDLPIMPSASAKLELSQRRACD